MKKSFNVDSTFNDMRIDRWIRNNLGNYPQGLIEKSLKSGKVKINSKKIKSSHKVKTGDIIDLFNFDFKETIVQKTIKFVPSEEVIKENEELIIDNNDARRGFATTITPAAADKTPARCPSRAGAIKQMNPLFLSSWFNNVSSAI